jgi:hypothetical protein
MILPMQRITRYALLLRRILHYTLPTHPHYNSCLLALQASENFLESLNESVKIGESELKIQQIQKLVDLKIPGSVYYHFF